MEQQNLHTLLLLSDSALPLGSFAFSSGLESYLAHTKPARPNLPAYLRSSIANTASTQLPFARTTWHDPCLLGSADDIFDASTPCAVARRASLAQGRALGSVWARALRPGTASGATRAVDAFVKDLTGGTGAGHLAPLWGATCAALGLGEEQSLYLLVLGQAKAVVSAAVRAGTLGPYAGQALLASDEVRGWIGAAVREALEGEVGVDAAGVTVPAIDLWMGRHELLYSRIFNS